MPPSRFSSRREKREVTPFADDDDKDKEKDKERQTGKLHCLEPEIPAAWRQVEAPINFTWVGEDALAGMGWPKSRDQVQFLVDQGIDHLVTLSADKIPPHYAFPQLKWSLIHVEDFTGPTIRQIVRFINIMDEARKLGEVQYIHIYFRAFKIHVLFTSKKLKRALVALSLDIERDNIGIP
jgi:hypothetical protein